MGLGFLLNASEHWQKQAWLCRSKYKFLSIKKDKLSVPLQVYDSKLVPTTLGEKHVKTDSSLKSVCRPELYHLRTTADVLHGSTFVSIFYI